MTTLEAKRNIVLHELGWLGEYKYEDLGIVDQLHIDERVERMELTQKSRKLLNESLAVLEDT